MDINNLCVTFESRINTCELVEGSGESAMVFQFKIKDILFDFAKFIITLYHENMLPEAGF